MRRFSNPADQLVRLEASVSSTVSRPLPRGLRQPRAVQRRLSTEDVERLVAGYLEGCTITMLAGRFGVHKRTVSAHLQRAGVARRYRLLGQAEVVEAVGLYAAGSSLARLGERYDVQPNTVRRALRAAGVVTRPRPGH